MPIISFILFGASIYLAVMSIKMKKTGEIVESLINKKIKLDRARDKAGFIDYMFLRGLITGVVCAIAGAIMVYSDFYKINYWVNLAAEVVFFGGLIYYGIVSVKGQNKYLI